MDLLDPPTTSHPAVAVLDQVETNIEALAATPLFTLDTATTAEVLKRLTVLEARVAAVKLTALSHAGTVDVAGQTSASSTATWLAHATRTTRADAFAQTRLAAALNSDQHTAVRDALAAGGLLVDQACVIIHAVEELPDDLDPALVSKAEVFLLEQATLFDAHTLKTLGKRLLEVVAPDKVDAYEAKKLAEEEKKAAHATRLTVGDDGHGSVFVRAKIPTRYGAMLKKLLLAFAAPKHQAATAAQAGVPTPERTPSPQRMGQAFCDLLESITDDDLPRTGGVGATVVVTMDLDTLLGGLHVAHLDTGQAISADQARRMACEAGIIPAVLGSQSVPLDLGRKTRFHTKTQRIAIALRDGGCTAEGCDWPPGMCHVHHDPPWATGGVTDIQHARMLCPHHHTRAHDPAYDQTTRPDGTVRFHRRI